MTRKDYEVVAEIVAETMNRFDTEEHFTDRDILTTATKVLGREFVNFNTIKFVHRVEQLVK